MSTGLAELHHQRGQLLERIAHQRVTLARQMGPLQSVLTTADRATAATRSGVQYAKEHPAAVAMAVAAIVLLRPKRAWRLLSRGVVVWRSWRALRPWVSQPLVSQLLHRYF